MGLIEAVIAFLYAFEKPPISIFPSFYTGKEFIVSYVEKSGRDVSNIDYYIKFPYFKLAVICQKKYYRYAKGQTRNDRFVQMDKMVAVLIKQASKAIK